MPNGNTGAPYGYPGDREDEKGNLKRRSGTEEFKTKNSLLAVSSKGEIGFRLDDGRDSTNEAKVTVRVIDGEQPEELTRIALKDTMSNWSKEKYNT